MNNYTITTIDQLKPGDIFCRYFMDPISMDEYINKEQYIIIDNERRYRSRKLFIGSFRRLTGKKICLYRNNITVLLIKKNNIRWKI